MNRQDFLQGLEAALVDEVSPAQVQSNLRYYREYISEQISLGRPEEEVMAELGDPRLIARSIVNAAVAGEESQGFYREESGASARYNYRESASEGGAQYQYQQEEQYAYRTPEEESYVFREETRDTEPRMPWVLTGWKATLAIALGIVAVIAVISAAFHLAFRILLSPVFWGLLVVWMIWRSFRDR